MKKETFENSLAGGAHHLLSLLAGKWTGTTKTWFGPDELADDSAVTGTITVILGSRFIRHEYEGTFQGKLLSGLCVYGYHLGTGKIQSSWVDSFHTGTEIMFGEGELAEKGFGYKSSYHAGENSPRWSWRTTVELKSENELVIIAYNVSPDGEETKAQETVYKRV